MVVVGQGRADEEQDSVEGEDDFAQHFRCRNDADAAGMLEDTDGIAMLLAEIRDEPCPARICATSYTPWLGRAGRIDAYSGIL